MRGDLPVGTGGGPRLAQANPEGGEKGGSIFEANGTSPSSSGGESIWKGRGSALEALVGGFVEQAQTGGDGGIERSSGRGLGTRGRGHLASVALQVGDDHAIGHDSQRLDLEASAS